MTTFTLDPARRSPEAEAFAAALRHRIVGQDRAVERLAEAYQVFLAGLGRSWALVRVAGNNLSRKKRHALQ